MVSPLGFQPSISIESLAESLPSSTASGARTSSTGTPSSKEMITPLSHQRSRSRGESFAVRTPSPGPYGCSDDIPEDYKAFNDAAALLRVAAAAKSTRPIAVLAANAGLIERGVARAHAEFIVATAALAQNKFEEVCNAASRAYEYCGDDEALREKIGFLHVRALLQNAEKAVKDNLPSASDDTMRASNLLERFQKEVIASIERISIEHQKTERKSAVGPKIMELHGRICTCFDTLSTRKDA